MYPWSDVTGRNASDLSTNTCIDWWSCFTSHRYGDIESDESRCGPIFRWGDNYDLLETTLTIQATNWTWMDHQAIAKPHSESLSTVPRTRLTWPRRSIPTCNRRTRKNKIISNLKLQIGLKYLFELGFWSGIMVGLADTSQYTKLQQG